jgi:WD40 repeat protein
MGRGRHPATGWSLWGNRTSINLVAVVGLVAVVVFVQAAPTPTTQQATQAEIARLIRQLGSDSFVEREKATRRLEKIGDAAMTELRRALADPDAEISGRAYELIEALEGRYWMKGHSQEVVALAVSRLGDRVLSAGNDGTVRLWDLERCKEIRQMEGPSGQAWGVAFSPDGKLALAGGQSGSLGLYEVVTGKKVRDLPAHPQAMRAVVFTPDGRKALSACYDNILRLWNVDTGVEVRSFKGHNASIMSVACAPTGKLAATGSLIGDCSVRLWDLDTGKAVHILKGHTERVMGVAFTPDSKKVVSSAWDGAVRIWDVATGKELLRCSADSEGAAGAPRLGLAEKRPIKGPEGTVGTHFYGVAVSPDGRLIASGNEAGLISLWDLATGKRVGKLGPHRGYVSEVAFTPDGRRLVSCSGDGTLRVWHLP